MKLMAELNNGTKCQVAEWHVAFDTLLVEMKHPDVTYSISKIHLDDCKRLYWENGETIYEDKTS